MDTLNYFESRIEATFSPMDYMNVIKENPEKYVLIDVRNAPPHILKVKIKGAQSIALKDIENNLSKIPKDKTIVVYCWDTWCNMAAHAAVILIKNGFKVKELIGGIAAWQSMNLPVEEL